MFNLGVLNESLAEVFPEREAIVTIGAYAAPACDGRQVFEDTRA